MIYILMLCERANQFELQLIITDSEVYKTTHHLYKNPELYKPGIIARMAFGGSIHLEAKYNPWRCCIAICGNLPHLLEGDDEKIVSRLLETGFKVFVHYRPLEDYI